MATASLTADFNSISVCVSDHGEACSYEVCVRMEETICAEQATQGLLVRLQS